VTPATRRARELRDRRRHVVAKPPRAQEPHRAALDQPARVDQHLHLHGVVDLVVEGLDVLPQLHEAEDLARQQVRADDLVRLGARRLHQPVDERAADAVQHAVDDVRRDDLARQRVARHVRRIRAPDWSFAAGLPKSSPQLLSL
jgi:hypothetical protein